MLTNWRNCTQDSHRWKSFSYHYLQEGKTATHVDDACQIETTLHEEGVLGIPRKVYSWSSSIQHMLSIKTLYMTSGMMTWYWRVSWVPLFPRLFLPVSAFLNCLVFFVQDWGLMSLLPSMLTCPLVSFLFSSCLSSHANN